MSEGGNSALDMMRIQSSMQQSGGGDAMWLKDQQMGAGLALNHGGLFKNNIPISFFGQKGGGFVDSKIMRDLGIKTKVQFSGEMTDLTGGLASARMDEIFGSGDGTSSGGGGGNATYEQIYGSGMTILQHGAQMGGFFPEAMATGFGAVSAPATPAMGGRGAEMEL